MSKPDFQVMTLEELRAYVLLNRTDDDALHEIALRARAAGKTIPIDEFDLELRKRLQQSTSGS